MPRIEAASRDAPTALRGPGARPHGFTLLELLAVLAVLALVLSVAIPSLSGGAGARHRAAAYDLAAGLRQARSQALTRGEAAVLTLDLEERRFRISGEPKVRRLPADLDLALYTARSELVGERSGSIRFYPDGSSTGGRITLLSSSTRRYLIDVDWLTGRVRVLDEES